VLVLVGDRVLWDVSSGEAGNASLICAWAATASAVIVMVVTAAGRRPPLATGAGVVALTLVVPALAAGHTTATVRVIAVAAGAAFSLAVAVFAAVVLGVRSRWAVDALAVVTVLAVTARLVVRDPLREVRCAPYCGENPLMIVGRPEWVLTADRLLAAGALVWCLATGILVARSRVSVWARVSTALAVAAVALNGLISWVSPGLTIWSDPTSRVAALVPLVLVPAFLLATQRDLLIWRTRADVRRMIADLSSSAGQGGVAEHLQTLLGDASIRLLFPVGRDILLDADGRVTMRDGEAATTVERTGEAIAVIEHQSRSGGQLGAVLTPSVTMAVENERLRAVARSELEELRSSRLRIVERADATRRRLERDLHDGAQQRLLLLGMELSRAAEAAEACERARYLSAVEHTQRALAELRNLVHEGLPPVLDELGLVEALRSLAETAPIPIVIEHDGSAGQRPPVVVERVVYGLALSMLASGHAHGASTLTIQLGQLSGRFTATIAHDAAAVVDTTNDEDRVGAVGGTLVVASGAEGVGYVASFP
jgi:signal transduction histidine kinase